MASTHDSKLQRSMESRCMSWGGGGGDGGAEGSAESRRRIRSVWLESASTREVSLAS